MKTIAISTIAFSLIATLAHADGGDNAHRNWLKAANLSDQQTSIRNVIADDAQRQADNDFAGKVIKQNRSQYEGGHH